MKKNVGKTDEIIRYVLGVVFIALGYYVHWAFYIVGAASIITGAVGWCALYKLLGINTNKK